MSFLGTKPEMDKWNRIESSELNPHLHSQLIYEKENKKVMNITTSLSIREMQINSTMRYHLISVSMSII